jgi:hypothetical protein
MDKICLLNPDFLGIRSAFIFAGGGNPTIDLSNKLFAVSPSQAQ